jgi:hypothetical protein
MKEMALELSRLKRMYADLALENQALKDLIEKKGSSGFVVHRFNCEKTDLS